MSWRTTLFLIVIVASLGGAIWWQTRREESYVEGKSERLFDGVEISRVRSIRIEALERPPGVRLERDARGDWLITDPIAYPARAAMIEQLLDIVRRNMAQPATAAEIAARDAPFERLGLFEVDEALEDGRRRTTRIEVGDVDIDGMRLWVRKDGRILRTLRNLDTVLHRDVNELRSDRIFAIDPRELVRFERRGVDLRGERVESIDLRSRSDVYAWRLESPFRARLDPGAWSLYLASLSALKIQVFVDDEVQALGPYGLDAPQVRLVLEDRHGRIEEAIFAQGVEDGVWYAHREGTPYVWQLEDGGAVRFFERVEEFLDPQLVRVFRDDVRRVELVTERGIVALERERETREQREPRWLLSTRAPGGEPSPQRPAERARVDELLGVLEKAELRHLLDEDLGARFPETAPRRGVWIEDVRGVRQGGRIGAAHTWSDGTDGFLFARDQEDVVAFVDAEVGALLELDAAALASRRLVEVEEVEQRRMVISSGDRSRVYLRATGGAWRHETSGMEAKELRGVLDQIFFLRASEHLPEAAAAAPLERAVAIELASVRAKTTNVTIGLDPEGRVVADVLGQRSVLAEPALHEKLEALLAE